MCFLINFFFFFFNDTATTEIYTLSLHDALPISGVKGWREFMKKYVPEGDLHDTNYVNAYNTAMRSEEHTSELQSHVNLVCRLLLEKKKKLIRQLNLNIDICYQTQLLQSDIR